MDVSPTGLGLTLDLILVAIVKFLSLNVVTLEIMVSAGIQRQGHCSVHTRKGIPSCEVGYISELISRINWVGSGIPGDL